MLAPGRVSQFDVELVAQQADRRADNADNQAV